MLRMRYLAYVLTGGIMILAACNGGIGGPVPIATVATLSGNTNATSVSAVTPTTALPAPTATLPPPTATPIPTATPVPVPLAQHLFVNSLGSIYALDASNGNQLWSYPNATFTHTPVLYNNLVYFNDIAPGNANQGELVAVDAFSGAVRWRAPLSSVFGGQAAAGDGIVVVALDQNGLQAFDASTGATTWHVALSIVGSSTQMVVSGDTLLIPGVNGNLLALNITNGAVKWEKSGDYNDLTVSQGTIYGVYTCSGGTIIIISTYNICVAALRLADGGQLWATAVSGLTCTFIFFCSGGISAPILQGGMLYTVYPFYSQKNNQSYQETRVSALRASDGGFMWTWTIPNSYGQSSGAPVYTLQGVDSASLYYEGSAGLVTALDPSRRTARWQAQLINGMGTLVGFQQNNAYFVSNTIVYAIRTSDGSTAWSTAIR